VIALLRTTLSTPIRELLFCLEKYKGRTFFNVSVLLTRKRKIHLQKLQNIETAAQKSSHNIPFIISLFYKRISNLYVFFLFRASRGSLQVCLIL
jgi:hypothetical protein